MGDSFYVIEGDLAVPTDHTRGPWDRHAQHAGPPAAMLGRALEACDPRDGLLVARVTFDILRPVPIAPLRIEARIVRPGKSVELLEASMSDAEGRRIMNASAWRIRVNTATETLGDDISVPDGPEHGTSYTPEPWSGDLGYHTSMEWLFVEGAMTRPGPATTWFRMRMPLVDGETPSPLQRVLIAADSGNGISNVLDFTKHVFINTDLTVNLVRPAEGEWVCLQAETLIAEGGAGLATSALFDARGRIGRSMQTLYVTTR